MLFIIKKIMTTGIDSNVIIKIILRIFMLKMIAFIAFLTLVLLLVGDMANSSSNDFGNSENIDLSREVLMWRAEVEYWAENYEIESWVWRLLAMMEVETRGLIPDLMQSSESAGLPPNTLEYEDSIAQGVRYLASIIARAEMLGLGDDYMAIIQSYNFGINYINWLANRRLNHNINVSAYYSRTVVAPSLGNHTGARFEYRNEVSIANGRPWLYWNGGNFHYAYVVMNVLNRIDVGGIEIRDGVYLPMNPPFQITCDFFCYVGHGGIDLSVGWGAPVRSVMAGRVIRVVNSVDCNDGWLGHPSGWGNLVEIDHGDGLRTLYAHLMQRIPVSVGDEVPAGMIIGFQGNSGNSTGTHLHFEWIENNLRIDPERRMDFRNH